MPNKRADEKQVVVSLFNPGMKLGEFELQRFVNKTDKGENWIAKAPKYPQGVQIHIGMENEQLLKNPPKQTDVKEWIIEERKQLAFKIGQLIDQWHLDKIIALGSSSEIWLAHESKQNKPTILKLLSSSNETIQKNFANEIQYQQDLASVTGIIPMLAHKIQEKPSLVQPSWIALPIVMPVKKLFDSKTPLLETMSLCIQIIQTFFQLLEKKYYYSDLKLDNIAYYHKRYIFIDLGGINFSAEDLFKNDELKTEARILATERFANILEVLMDMCKKHDKTVEDIYKKTQKNKKKTDALQVMLNELIQHHQHLQSINKKLKTAYKYFNTKQFIQTKTVCDELLNEHPKQADAIQLLGLIAYEETNYKKALAMIKKAISYNPSDPTYYNNLGSTLQHLDSYEEAINAYQQAIELEPNYNDAYNNLGIAKQQHANQEKNKRADVITKKNKKPNSKAILHKEDKDRLLNFCSKDIKLLAEYENKLLLQGKIDKKQGTDSCLTLSWDQYFTDLSFGSYRNVLDGERRAHRIRAWHYLFKNLALVDKIFNSPAKTLDILDIGCSTGYLRRFLEGNYSKNDNKKIYYWGLDIREDVLKRGVFLTDDIESGAFGQNIPSAFIRHDVKYALPFNTNLFDLIANFEMIKYLPIEQGKQLIAECHRVLKPGGIFYLSTSYAENKPGYMYSLDYNSLQVLLQEQQFNVTSAYGSQTTFAILKDNIKPEHQELFNALIKYHPPEIVAAFMIPLYPQCASQVTFVAKKI